MRIVVDTNILFSFFWKDSHTRKLLINANSKLISSEFALEEIRKYSKEIIIKAKISEDFFNDELKKLKLIVKFIKKEEHLNFIKDAEEISPDKKDAEFLALCLKFSCPLWSNDSILKNQNKIRVLSTEDLIEVLF